MRRACPDAAPSGWQHTRVSRHPGRRRTSRQADKQAGQRRGLCATATTDKQCLPACLTKHTSLRPAGGKQQPCALTRGLVLLAADDHLEGGAGLGIGLVHVPARSRMQGAAGSAGSRQEAGPDSRQKAAGSDRRLRRQGAASAAAGSSSQQADAALLGPLVGWVCARKAAATHDPAPATHGRGWACTASSPHGEPATRDPGPATQPAHPMATFFFRQGLKAPLVTSPTFSPSGLRMSLQAHRGGWGWGWEEGWCVCEGGGEEGVFLTGGGGTTVMMARCFSPSGLRTSLAGDTQG